MIPLVVPLYTLYLASLLHNEQLTLSPRHQTTEVIGASEWCLRKSVPTLSLDEVRGLLEIETVNSDGYYNFVLHTSSGLGNG